ncbi:hypothetical protein TNCV_3644131 [Trichonephila clavipes]|nr:hypothetical protein TNCV_3644131 [Trichonephila clavipes]
MLTRAKIIKTEQPMRLRFKDSFFRQLDKKKFQAKQNETGFMQVICMHVSQSRACLKYTQTMSCCKTRASSFPARLGDGTLSRVEQYSPKSHQ